jgi:hypothetical protein
MIRISFYKFNCFILFMMFIFDIGSDSSSDEDNIV